MGAAVALLFFMDQPSSAEATYPFSSMENILAFVAGIMTAVALVELFPQAARHSREENLPLVLGTATGVVIMLASEAALQ